MRKRNLLSLLAALVGGVMTAFLPGFVVAEDTAEKGFALMKEEAIGDIKLSLSADKVKKALGKPAKIGAEEEWGATGDFVQKWEYPALGLDVHMASAKKGGKKTVLSVMATSPCKLATKRGIKIGSPEAAVGKAYGAFRDKEASQKGKAFVAGTLYGGVIFEIKAGVVVSIFLGAAAE